MAEEQTLSERIMHFAGNNSEFIPRTEVFRDATGGDGEGEPDAAASQDDALGADQEGNLGEDADNGLDTASDEEGSGADQGDEGDADEHDQKDEEGKGTKKKTFEERLAEIEAKQAAKLAELEAKLSQRPEPEKPDFVEVNMEAVNAYLIETEDKIEEMKLNGNLYEAKKLQRQIDKLLSDIEENDAKKAAWENRTKERAQQEAQANASRKSLEDKAELYRQHMGIDEGTFKKLGDFFAAKVTTDPLLNTEFNEIYQKQGELAAIRFAHKYAVDNIGATAKQSIEKKEQTKTKTAAIAAASTGQKVAVDLRKIKAEFDADPTPDNFARYMDARRRAAK